MEANLTFNLNTLADEARHYQCVHSEEMALVLWEIAHNLRKRAEWAADNDPKADPIDIVFEMINDLIINSNINIDKLIE